MKIWARLGIELDVPEQHGLKILQGDREALLDTLSAPNAENGSWQINGDSYIPQTVIEELGEKYSEFASGDVEFNLPIATVIPKSVEAEEKPKSLLKNLNAKKTESTERNARRQKTEISGKAKSEEIE